MACRSRRRYQPRRPTCAIGRIGIIPTLRTGAIPLITTTDIPPAPPITTTDIPPPPPITTRIPAIGPIHPIGTLTVGGNARHRQRAAPFEPPLGQHCPANSGNDAEETAGERALSVWWKPFMR